MAKSHQEVLVQCREFDIKIVTLHVTDILGNWHQLNIPVSRLTEESFEDGFPWTVHRLGNQRGHLSDVLLMPQPTTAFVEPNADPPTLSLICSMHDPLTREELAEDPRTIALKAEKYARESGVADTTLFEMAVEFYMFEGQTRVRYGRAIESQSRVFDVESSREPRHTSSSATLMDDFCKSLMIALLDCGVDVIAHHRSTGDRFKSLLEIGGAGLVTSADRLMITKHLVKRVAQRAGRSATFMPFPQANRQPAGMTTQLSMLKHETCVLTGAGYAGLSDAGMNAIGGILKHTAALTALTNSTTNSYCRLNVCPGSLPQIAYSQTNLVAALRVPDRNASKSKCLEFRLPDAVCNPYLAFSAMVMAAVDGVQNKTQPGRPLELDRYDSTEASSEEPMLIPASFDEALKSLESDAEFLFRGDVFSPEILQSWISHKRLYDVQAARSHPHPHELEAYFDS